MSNFRFQMSMLNATNRATAGQPLPLIVCVCVCVCGWGKTPALPTASTATAVWSPGTLQHSVAILVQDIFAVEHRSTASHDGATMV